MTHVELQSAVTSLLTLTGWHWLHVRRSIGKGRKWATTYNVPGWPDLAPIWNPRQPGRHLAVELKVKPDRLSVDQAHVMDELVVAGFECWVITDADIEKFAEVLQKPTGLHADMPAVQSFVQPDRRYLPSCPRENV